MPALIFNGRNPLAVNAGRILPGFDSKLRIIEKLIYFKHRDDDLQQRESNFSSAVPKHPVQIYRHIAQFVSKNVCQFQPATFSVFNL